eukprot:4087043-Prorocentrum_lima.AAC.1
MSGIPPASDHLCEASGSVHCGWQGGPAHYHPFIRHGPVGPYSFSGRAAQSADHARADCPLA